jgi:transcriptional regulator with PAS, ATPase and Fis domain
VVTLALREILQEDPDELHNLVLYIAGKCAGADEAVGITDEACQWIRGNLGLQYAWPGNFRELEQCVRNIMVHGEYLPENTQAEMPRDKLLSSALGIGSLTAEHFLREYISSVYETTQNYNETARLLELDRRTVKKYVDLADDQADSTMGN